MLILSLLLPLQSTTPQALLRIPLANAAASSPIATINPTKARSAGRGDVVAQPDGVTTVRTAAYDDGPKAGTVWITTLDVEGDKLARRRSAKGDRSKPATCG